MQFEPANFQDNFVFALTKQPHLTLWSPMPWLKSILEVKLLVVYWIMPWVAVRTVFLVVRTFPVEMRKPVSQDFYRFIFLAEYISSQVKKTDPWFLTCGLCNFLERNVGLDLPTLLKRLFERYVGKLMGVKRLRDRLPY